LPFKTDVWNNVGIFVPWNIRDAECRGHRWWS